MVRTATFLFAAGQETTAKLLGAAMRVLERPARHPAAAARRPQPDSDLHRGMSADGQPRQERVPDGPQDDDIRRHAVPAGTTVMVSPGAANRDPEPVREPARVLSSTARTSASTSRSAAGSIPARARRWRAWRAGSRSSASSTGWPTSPSARRSTGPIGARAVRLRADVHPARAHRDQHRVQARRLTCRKRWMTCGQRNPLTLKQFRIATSVRAQSPSKPHHIAIRFWVHSAKGRLCRSPRGTAPSSWEWA